MLRDMARVEPLESRRLLSGNLTVTAGPNFTATITGDKKSNSLEVRLAPEGYLIRGLSRTTINRSRELLLRTPTAANLIISLGKGNDTISFLGAFNTQSVSIVTGDGDDRVNISRVSHFGRLHIATERDDDTVSLASVVVMDDLIIHTGDDKDQITLASVRVEGDASLNGGRGKNSLTGTGQLSVGETKTIRALNSGKSTRDHDDDHDDDDDDRDHEHDDD